MQATAPGKYRQNWQHGHDQWCGKSCELNVDWAILDAGDSRGQGVFALRDFAVGEKIMVEGSSLEAALNSPVTPGDLRALSASVSARHPRERLSFCRAMPHWPSVFRPQAKSSPRSLSASVC